MPDHLQDIGLADDVLILQRVIARNQSDLHRILSEDSGGVGDGEDPGVSQEHLNNITNYCRRSP